MVRELGRADLVRELGRVGGSRADRELGRGDSGRARVARRALREASDAGVAIAGVVAVVVGCGLDGPSPR